ncbi:Hypothetical protein, putative [Bodo saltans]|uniref:Uncharacterized protein n=1 Tax=Bodo saltans TaxID=75058 RepID=A0A0S4JC81_BODSA|nr:Hypothetical protein, putative [Bodo saltans]|eukprot:CUG86773.1 Hypothetical protein, putative [Bodo saltans]
MSLLLEGLSDVQAIFSDMDGTLVHYEKAMEKQGYVMLNIDGTPCASYNPTEHNTLAITRCGVEMQRVVFLHTPTETKVPSVKVPSLTLGGGYVSLASLELVEELRCRFGVSIILMTGARTSTMLMRRKSGTIPIVDYDVCEGGGKVFEVFGRPTLEEPTLCPSWTAQFVSTTGAPEQLDSDPLTRQGPLWDVFRILHADGYHLDAKSFSTSFLVDLGKSKVVLSGSKSIDEAERDVKQQFTESITQKYNVTYISNLGKGQVCPVGCNKRTAMEHLAKTLGISATYNQQGELERLPTSVAMFDDENDLEFARKCAAGFIPSIAHASVLDTIAAAAKDGEALCWHRTPIEGPLGTEAALREIIKLKESREQ